MELENKNLLTSEVADILNDLDDSDLDKRLEAIKAGLDHSDTKVKRKAILRGLICFDENTEKKAKDLLVELIKSIIKEKYAIYRKLIYSFHKPQSDKEIEGVFIDSVNHIFLNIYYAYGESTANIQNWEGYIYWTMRNYFTRNKNKSERSIPVPPDFILDALNENTVEEEYFDYQAYKLALGKLSAKHQKVIRLRHEQGFSITEIAGKMNMNPGAVRSLIYRAKKKLMSHYEKIIKQNSK